MLVELDAPDVEDVAQRAAEVLGVGLDVDHAVLVVRVDRRVTWLVVSRPMFCRDDHLLAVGVDA